jgi:hypothetical protein
MGWVAAFIPTPVMRGFIEGPVCVTIIGQVPHLLGISSTSGNFFTYQLGYACQRETRTDRLIRKARRVHRALGAKETRSRGVHRINPRGCIGKRMSGNSPTGPRRWKRQTASR